MSQNPKVWEINGVSLTLDLDNVEVMERYETAFDKMEEEEKMLPKEGRASAILRAYCEMYQHLFENIFGDAAKQIFEGVPMSAQQYEGIYVNFLDFAQAQAAATVQKRAQMLSKYIPNRAQKRAAKHK